MHGRATFFSYCRQKKSMLPFFITIDNSACHVTLDENIFPYHPHLFTGPPGYRQPLES